MQFLFDKFANYVKVRKSQKEINLFSFSPRNEWTSFTNSVLGARAESQKDFGGNEYKVICFWY